VIALVSDHGDMLGDSGLWEKFVPHDAALRVPMVLAGPGIARGRIAETPASFIDLHATFIEMAGAAPIAGIDSRSMVPVLADPRRRHRDVAFSGLGNWRLAFDGRFKALIGYDPALPWQLTRDSGFEAEGPRLLIDAAADPAEGIDLSDRHPEVADRLFAAIARHRDAPHLS
jgi:arylsulfatase A-like enzyme